MAGNLDRLQRAAALVTSSSSAAAAVDDDDAVGLSAAARDALLAALAETAATAALAAREADLAATGLALATSEDWQLSQFWYAKETSRGLAGLVLSLAREAVAGRSGAGAGAGAEAAPRAAVVACLSCPSVFKALRALLAEEEGEGEKEGGGGGGGGAAAVRAHVLEFDRRFAVFGEEAFSFYDYRSPLDLPPSLVGACDVVVLDPPFLNRECLAEFARSVAALRGRGAARVVLCTGAVMLPAARELLGARPTRAEVRHSSGRLSNPFTVFVDFAVEDSHPFLGGIDIEAERAAAEDGGAMHKD